MNYFLGVEVCWQGSSLHLSQTKYIQDLLTRVGFAGCKPIAILMTTSHTLSVSDGSLLADPSQYRNIVGALQYCTITRPDIFFSVNKLCYSCNHQLIFIRKLLNSCCDISRALLPLVFLFILLLIFNLLLMLMLIGLVAVMIVEVQVVIVSFFAII